MDMGETRFEDGKVAAFWLVSKLAPSRVDLVIQGVVLDARFARFPDLLA